MLIGKGDALTDDVKLPVVATPILLVKCFVTERQVERAIVSEGRDTPVEHQEAGLDALFAFPLFPELDRPGVVVVIVFVSIEVDIYTRIGVVGQGVGLGDYGTRQ